MEFIKTRTYEAIRIYFVGRNSRFSESRERTLSDKHLSIRFDNFEKDNRMKSS